jgi:archaellum component FlaC
VIHLEAWESPHPQILGATRVVFRTITSDGEVLKEAAILNLGAEINVQTTVEWMGFRWLQENDFKYQTDHFGLNELTSYTTIPYEEIAEELEDRLVPNAVRKALLSQNAELQKELGKVLIAGRKGKKDAAGVLKTLEEINQQLQSAESTTEFIQLRKQANKAIKRCERFFERTKQKQADADRIDQERSRIRKQLKKLPSEVSRLETLIQAEKVRHDFVAKEFFDTIKMIARNMFCLQLRAFRNHYDNLRDDHVLLRDFTRSPGTLVEGSSTELLIHPGFMSSRRKLQKNFTNYVEEITAKPEQNPYENIRLVRSQDAFELAMNLRENTA